MTLDYLFLWLNPFDAQQPLTYRGFYQKAIVFFLSIIFFSRKEGQKQMEGSNEKETN